MSSLQGTRGCRVGLLCVVLAGSMGLGAATEAAESREALYTAMARHNCSVAPDDVARVFAPLGFSRDFVSSTLTELLLDGTASQDAQGRLSLPPDLCPPIQPTAAPRDAVLEAFRNEDCRIASAGLPDLRERLSMDDEQLLRVIGPLYDSGDVRIEGSSAILADPLCGQAATD